MKLSNPDLSLRIATEEDQPFLLNLYHHGRAAELALFGFSAEQERAFVQMQFRARTMHYHQLYPSAQDLIVLLHGQRIGRLIVNESKDWITVVDIALMPENCGAGLGRQIMSDLTAYADERNLSIELHVDMQNVRAKKLYCRIGFEVSESVPPFELMVRRATQLAS